jgi:DNA replication protein DnaC
MHPALEDQLKYLKLGYLLRHHPELTAEAAQARWSHAEFLRRLIEAETLDRQTRAHERRIQAARFPVRKTLDQFKWDWPKQLNEAQVRHLFELRFVTERTNAVFCGGVGLGKTHLATALGYAACQAGHTVLFTTAVDAINALVTAQALHRLPAELKRYVSPALLILDEVGYLPLDKAGADLLFQIVSQRYERGALTVTTNKADFIGRVIIRWLQRISILSGIFCRTWWRGVNGQAESPVSTSQRERTTRARGPAIAPAERARGVGPL